MAGYHDVGGMKAIRWCCKIPKSWLGLHMDMAENLSRCDDLIAKFIDTKAIIPELPLSKLRTLLMELDVLIDEFEREMSIMYISGNYTSSSHLCTMVLRGKNDDEIKDIMSMIRKELLQEIESRKSI